LTGQPSRAAPNWQDSHDGDVLYAECIVKCVGESLGQHAVAAILLCMDTGIDLKGFNICQQATPKIIAYSPPETVVESAAVKQILPGLILKPGRPLTHPRRSAFNASSVTKFAAPDSIFARRLAKWLAP
jgi:hypothetical protein